MENRIYVQLEDLALGRKARNQESRLKKKSVTKVLKTIENQRETNLSPGIKHVIPGTSVLQRNHTT